MQCSDFAALVQSEIQHKQGSYNHTPRGSKTDHHIFQGTEVYFTWSGSDPVHTLQYADEERGLWEGTDLLQTQSHS